MFKHVLRCGAPVLLACISQASLAADRFLLETPITYSPDAGVVEHVRQECKVEQQIETHITQDLAKRNGGGETTLAAGGDPHGLPVVRVTITFVLGVGGGGWSGPKSITVNAKLLQGGQVKAEQRLRRTTTGGVWGGFKGTCSILDRASTAIAKDVILFADNALAGKPAPETEPEPKTTEAAAGAASEVANH